VPANESTSKQATKNYEIDRTVEYTKHPAGRLRRITVAVLIDNVRTTAKDGKTKETPLAKEQLDHINQLVKDAVGYDEKRGDSVNVVNASFTQDTTPAPAGELVSPKIWESPMFLDIAKIAGGLVVLLVLVLSVIRPLVKNLIAPTAQQMQVNVLPKQAEAAGGPGAPAANGSDTPALPSASQKAAATHEQQVQQARTLVTQDPKRVAQVVKGWVAKDD